MSHQSILQLLGHTTVDSIVPAQESLVVIDSKDILPKAFHQLASNNIYSAPVYDSNAHEYLGFLDLLDIIAFIVKICDAQQEVKGSNVASVDLYELLEQVEKFDLEHATRIVGLATQNPMCPVRIGSSLKKALEVFEKSGVHRIPIVEGKKLKNVLTQSAVISWFHKNIGSVSETLRKKTVRQLGIGLKPVISVRIDSLAIDAFRIMAQHQIHGIAVVDEKGEIFSNLSAKDIKVLEPDALFTKMYRPVLELIQIVRSQNLKAVFPSFCVNLDSTFEETIKKMDVLKVHRLYIEDDRRIPIGVISLGDIISQFAHEPEERIPK